MLHNEWLGIYVHLHLILASFCLRSVSCGFEEHWMNFLISLVLFIKTTIAKLLRNVIFFSFFSFSFRDQTKAKEEKSMRKEFRDRFFSIFLVALHSARKKFFDEIFMWESRNDSESAWAVCSTYIGETCNLLLRAWAFVKLSLSFSRKSPAYPKWNLRSRQTLNISRKTLSSSSKLIHNRNINFRRSSKHIKRQIRSGTRRASECLIFFLVVVVRFAVGCCPKQQAEC